MIHGRDIKIKLFSKWRPSAILNFRSLQFLSRDLYWHVIFHLRSKFRINRTIWRRDLCPKRFSKWRPFDILNLQNFDVFWSEVQTRNGNLHLHTKFDGNRIIHSWNMEIKLFSKWRPSAILNLRKMQFWSRDLYWYVILNFLSKFRINQPIWHRKKRIFNMASVRHLEFAKFRFFLSIEICITADDG